MKITPSFLPPLFLKYTGCHCNLIGAAAEDDLERGAAVDAVCDSVRICGVAERRHAWSGGQSVFAALCVVGNPAVAIITWDRHHACGEEEGSVCHQFVVGTGGDEAFVLARHVPGHFHRGAWRQCRVESVKIEPQ